MDPTGMLDRHTAAAGGVQQARATAPLLLERGRRPPVLASQNLDGRPVAGTNAELFAPSLERAGRRP